MKYIGNLPVPLPDNPSFVSALTRFLEGHVAIFSDDLIGDLSHINSRAECYTYITIEGVSEVGHNEYQMNYSYDWYVYNGCANLDESDQVTDSTFVYIGENGEVEVDIPEPSERTTFDEF